MSHHLWQSLLENDPDSFRQHLAHATYTSLAPKHASIQVGGHSPKIGSPGTLGTSPKVPLRPRKSYGNASTSAASGRSAGPLLTRAEINAKDAFGRTLLHHAASKQSPEAHDFVKGLLEIPFVDLYAQDMESGWTALHRALYFGNITTAQALMQKDIQDATDYTTTAAHTQAGGLVKIKDTEGNSPFEVFGLTIAPRDIQTTRNILSAGFREDDSSNSVDLNDDQEDTERSKRLVRPTVDLRGDEVFAFGSNKNLTLGTGDEDDRHFPETLHFTRPDHLLRRLYEDHAAERQKAMLAEDLTASFTSLTPSKDIPTLTQNKPIVIQDVVMSKLHTAVLTADPICNLYVCGFGPGGRLGTGDETTSFNYQCIQGGGLAKKCVSSIALGQDHSIAICSQGEVFTWGSNRYGQLGYTITGLSAKEAPIQLVPRQVYGLVKRELFVGAAASSLHSAIYTSTSLYTFGKNEGQLGLTDADARSLGHQTIPRRVAPSVLFAPIKSVSAIDRATTVLLESHDVIVFTHFGWAKVSFQLDGFTNYFLSEAVTTRYDDEGNSIRKITSGGNTICAMSSYGEVFNIEVPKVADTATSDVSTTNPSKARNALPTPTRVWSIRKAHMSAIDVAVGQDGSIILCTTSGSVWRKEKRANIKSMRAKDGGFSKPKDYKFVRVPNITRAVAVRSNAFGAFAAVRKDSDVMAEQLLVGSACLWSDLFPLLPFYKYGDVEEDESDAAPQLRFWKPATKGPSPARIRRAVMIQKDSENDIRRICSGFEMPGRSQHDIWITSNVTDVRIPVHSLLFKARSKVIRAALAEFYGTYYYEIADLMAVEYGQDGQIQIQFRGADFLTLTNLALYLYSDEVIDVWQLTSKLPRSAARYRAVRVELMKIAQNLELHQLERAVRLMIDPAKSLCLEMELALIDPDLFCDADIIIDLSDGAEQLAHSILLCARCPFFKGLLDGRAGGSWISSRREIAEENSDILRVDFKHVEARVFALVLRHIYADTGVELFDDMVSRDMEEFAELVLEVLFVANELMIDRLAQVCQHVLGKFVNVRNVCRLLNAVADCSVSEFKQAALEYICLNLESMLEHRLLEELDPELLSELDDVVRENQLAYMPFARSNRAQNQLLEHYPELLQQLEEGKQRRIDSMRLRSRLVDDEQRATSSQKFRVGSFESGSSANLKGQTRDQDGKQRSPDPSPLISAKEMGEELPFEMDEDKALQRPLSRPELPSPTLSPRQTAEDEQSSTGLGQTPNFCRSFLGDAMLPPSQSPNSSIPETQKISVTSSAVTRTPWQRSPQLSKRVDFRDIMDQTSAGRFSGLTQSLRQAEATPKPGQKLSQKDRKRQLQLQKSRDPETSTQLSDAQGTNAREAQSPWQRVKPKQSALMTPAPLESTPSEEQSSPSQPKNIMTMRQTVAGSPLASKPQVLETKRRSFSPATTPSTKPAPPTIQSIRHTPVPVRANSTVDARTSMAEILAQQQTEKTSVKEAVSKRSLQEIQQEQAFQEWWDKETQRVQDEEAQASASTGRREKSGRGRGRQRGGGSDRGGAARILSNDGGGRRAVSQTSGQEHREGAGSSTGEARGRGKGRGRGQGH